MRCIIVDDEPLARERFRTLLRRSGREIEILAEAESGTKAIPLMYELRPDVVFLDIQMPGLSGFEVIDLLPTPRPLVVFITAYDEYALRAFEAHALDYLTKPVRLERLEKTLDYVSGLAQRQKSDEHIDNLRLERSSVPLARLTVHVGQRLRVVQLDEIRRIEAEDKLVYVHISDGRFRTDFTLDELEQRLGIKEFIRIHRSHLVRIAAVRELIPWFSGTYCLKLDDGTQLPVARRRTAVVKNLFGG